MWLPEAPQLGIRACQARPLKSFDTRDGLTFESPVVVLGCQDVVDNTSELFGNDGTGNTLVGATQHAFVERSDLRIVLDGPDSTVTERQFEILVTIFVSRFLSECPVGVVGTGDEPAIADEVFVGRETLDAIDLQVHGERSGLADTGDPEQALDVIVGNQDRMQRLLKGEDLITQQSDLMIEQLHL